MKTDHSAESTVTAPITTPSLPGTLALAHVGDAVYELYVRVGLSRRGLSNTGRLHRETTRRVCAQAQASAARRLAGMLDSQERDVFMRGRNVKLRNVPDSCTREEYQLATALEAVFGYLHLTGRTERTQALLESLTLFEDIK